jgi:AcrR family transcriptional regulator
MADLSESKEQLSRERIVATALAIVDEHGLDALSMRRLGAELGVDPMAVYYYVPNKEALLDAVVEAVMAEIDLSVDDPSAPPADRVVCAGTAYAEVLLHHANTLPVLLSRGPVTPGGLGPVDLLIGIFRDAGLSVEHAVAAMNVVAAAVRGYVGMVAPAVADPTYQPGQEELAASVDPETFPYLAEAVRIEPPDPREMLEFGLRGLATGLLHTA